MSQGVISLYVLSRVCVCVCVCVCVSAEGQVVGSGQDVSRGTLRILGVREGDGGEYSCVARSSAGTSSARVVLEVGGERSTFGFSVFPCSGCSNFDVVLVLE